MTRPPLTRLLLAPVLLSLLAAPGTALAASPQPPPAVQAGSALDPGLPRSGPAQRVVVTGGPSVADAVRRAGGTPGAPLPYVGGLVATVPADRLDELAAAPGVAAVTADRRVELVDYVWDATSTASNFTRTTQATSSWGRGHYGKSVGVAVIDTGVSPVADLDGRLVHGPDLSGEGTFVDTYGHGTVMAGLVAGSGASSASRSGGAYTGMAPASHVVSVKVAGRNGVVDVSTILQAMHWVSSYREQLGIRVLNLSWGVPSTQHPSVDPLNHAVQRLWSEGVVVVVAAGNSGPTAQTITKPGDDPVVLTVGAYNDEGDTDPSNDGVPSWSSRGPTAAGLAKADLVAPGRTVVSTRSPGSHVEATYPRSHVAPAYVKGSGSSQAAAITSGAIALLLAERPGLTPDQVKQVLRDSASPIAGAGTTAQGTGRLQLDAARATPATTAVQPLTASGLGSLDASRGGMRVVADCGGVATEIRGEIDVRCQPWDAARWAGVAWKGDAWTGVAWKGAEWTGVAWKGASWSDATWTGVAWKGGTWTGTSWNGDRGWTGDTAPSSPWTGVAWKDAAWTGVAWKDASWTTGDWTTGEYDEFLTAFWGPTPPAGQVVPGERFTPTRPAKGR